MSCYTEMEIGNEAVKVVANNPGIRTSELIIKLIDIMKPSGEDLEILEGRQDTKFSQKVRNLVSHNSLKDKITWIGDKNRQWYLK
ncbi:hypothetical protein YZ38_01245 [Campylobacter lari]|nr:hypothetical protein [Campylobacter lari]EAJ0347962.1 hypothetical protein [Campylobacter lari]EAK0804800.1 hypothetical protein [Campylobacter lari]EAK5534231.1 hypothetical protein [Campylobacter lari]EFB0440586.1 hypothetical protein [Campylobacter lari]